MNPDKEFVEITDETREIIIELFGYQIDDAGYVIDPDTGDRLVCPFEDELIHKNDYAIVPDDELGDDAGVLFIKPTTYAYAHAFSRED